MARHLTLILAAIGLVLVILAGWGYVTLRDFALNGTPTFNPSNHLVLSPLSFGLADSLASGPSAVEVDAAVYCIALERRLFALGFVGFVFILCSAALQRGLIRASTSDEGHEEIER